MLLLIPHLTSLLFKFKMAKNGHRQPFFEKTVGPFDPNYVFLDSGDQYASFGTPHD